MSQIETQLNGAFKHFSSVSELGCHPAIVVGIDNLTQGLVDVQPLTNKPRLNQDSVQYPTLHNIQIVTYSTLNSRISLPVIVGDTVLLMFTKHSNEQFKLGVNDIHDPEFGGMYTLGNAVALLGFNGVLDSIYNNNNYTNNLDFENLNIVHNADLENEVVLSLTKEGDVRIKAGKVISEAAIETPEDVVIKGVSVYQFMQTHVHPYINVATPAVTSPPLPTPPTSYTTEITKE